MKMLLDNHIAGFINQPYLNSNSVSQHGLLESWYRLKDDKRRFENFQSGRITEVLLANQIVEFFKKLYLKKNEINQPDIFYIDRDLGKVNCDLKMFGKGRS